MLEVVVEVLFRVTGRSLVAVARPALGIDEPSRGWKVVSWSLVLALSGALGWFRGGHAGSHPRWGLWLAVVVVGAGLVHLARGASDRQVGAVRASAAAPRPVAVLAGLVAESAAGARRPTRPQGLRATFTWWPRERVAWYVAANAVFAMSYLAAIVLLGSGPAR